MTEQDRKPAETKIRKLVEKYETEKSAGKISQYTEAETKIGFIEPLFQALGWDTQNRDEVGLETNISGGRVDYSFKLSGIVKFFVEAKPLKADLNNPEYSKQAINYSWHKGVVWAVLTDFESIKVFNAEWKEDIEKAKAFDLQYTDYLNDFDSLWLLSKESILSGQLDKWSEKFGKKTKKQPVSKQILADLLTARTKLTKNIFKYPRLNKISETELDESVQRILDRLIFIRTCEDRTIEKNYLRSAVRDRRQVLNNELKRIFREFDDGYNSKLFDRHICDDLTIDDEVLKEVVESLYQTQDGNIHYDFNAINADVLGSIYEQYLGHILKKSPTTAKLKETHQHRKEQGIYYTPTYIVDYIVKNTVGEVLKTAKPKAVQNIKILDPACGSGSFLIKAFDELVKYWAGELGGVRKPEILQNNIYGVDLDKQAVEITQMNLLLKTLYRREKLPMLKNIRCGNSLIADPKIAAEKAFNWEEEFKEIMSEGGFDVIIGNPPWVSIKGKQKSVDLTEKELNYLFEKYPCDKYRPNLFEMFIWRALSLLKEGGYFCFIVPDRLCCNAQFSNLRKHILQNFSLQKVWFRPIFEGVISDNVIFVIKKEKPTKKAIIEIAEYPSDEFKKIPQKMYSTLSDCAWFIADEKIFDIFEKVKSNREVFELGKKFQTKVGFIAQPNKITKTQHNNKQIKILKGENVIKFGIVSNYWFEFKRDNLAGGTQDIKKLGKKYKVFLRKTGIDIMASFDKTRIYPEQSVYFIFTDEDDEKSEIKLKIICLLLNSKLLNCYYKNFAVTNRDATPQLKKVDLDKFLIILPKDTKSFLQLADKMLDLNKQLQRFGDKITDERKRIESEIQKTDNQIDEMVYKFYGLTDEEIKTIEQ